MCNGRILYSVWQEDKLQLLLCLILPNPNLGCDDPKSGFPEPRIRFSRYFSISNKFNKSQYNQQLFNHNSSKYQLNLNFFNNLSILQSQNRNLYFLISLSSDHIYYDLSHVRVYIFTNKIVLYLIISNLDTYLYPASGL